MTLNVWVNIAVKENALLLKFKNYNTILSKSLFSSNLLTIEPLIISEIKIPNWLK